MSIATIKYYLREGLLPAGEPLGPTSADYGEVHLRRLRIIRAMRDVGGLSIDSIREVVRAADDPRIGMHDMLGAAQRAATGPVPDATAEARRAARDIVAARGWTVSRHAHGLRALAAALEPLQQFGQPVSAQELQPWVDAAERVALAEVAAVPAAAPRDVQAEFVAVGTVLYGKVFAALRLLAQESASAARSAQ